MRRRGVVNFPSERSRGGRPAALLQRGWHRPGTRHRDATLCGWIAKGRPSPGGHDPIEGHGPRHRPTPVRCAVARSPHYPTPVRFRGPRAFGPDCPVRSRGNVARLYRACVQHDGALGAARVWRRNLAQLCGNPVGSAPRRSRRPVVRQPAWSATPVWSAPSRAATRCGRQPRCGPRPVWSAPGAQLCGNPVWSARRRAQAPRAGECWRGGTGGLRLGRLGSGWRRCRRRRGARGS